MSNDYGTFLSGYYDPMYKEFNIAMLQDFGGDQVFDADPIEVTYHKRDYTKNFKPMLRLPEKLAFQLFKDLKKHFDGWKDKDQNKVEGLYESQTKHLEDMRSLVFTKNNKEKK